MSLSTITVRHFTNHISGHSNAIGRVRSSVCQRLKSRVSVSNGEAGGSVAGWLGSRVVSFLDSGAEGPGFKSQPRRCRVTVLGKLFAPIVPLFTKHRNWCPLKGCEGNCEPGGK